MYWLNTIVLMYIAGMLGSTIGALLFKPPKNKGELEFILISVLFWPHYSYVVYQRLLHKRAEELAEERVAALALQLQQTKQLLRVMAQSSMAQDAKYDELLGKYIEIFNLMELETKALKNGRSLFDVDTIKSPGEDNSV